MYDIGQCFKSETLNTLLGFFVTVVRYLINVHAMLAMKNEFELKCHISCGYFVFAYFFISLPSISQKGLYSNNKQNNHVYCSNGRP